MLKVLVTGGAGFVGSFLVDELIRKKFNVIIYDNLDKQVHIDGKKPKYLNKKAEFIKGDIRDYKKIKNVILTQKPDLIYHLAAKVGVGQSQYEIKEYMDVNVGGTSNILDILVNNKTAVKKLIVAASMSSYGEGLFYCVKCKAVFQPELRSPRELEKKMWEVICPDCGKSAVPKPTPENADQLSHSIYALSKKIQEDMCMIVGKTYKLPMVALRFFNIYGPRQSLSNPYTGVAAIFMSRIKNNKSPVIFEDGLQTRDFIYVTDIVAACILAMKSSADYQIFNVGTGEPISIKKIAGIIAKVYEKKVKLEITQRFRKGDIRHCYADIGKIKNKLGFRPRVSFEDGIKKLCEWAKTAEAIDMYDKAECELKQKGLA